jgi:hypothetical protein
MKLTFSIFFLLVFNTSFAQTLQVLPTVLHRDPLYVLVDKRDIKRNYIGQSPASLSSQLENLLGIDIRICCFKNKDLFLQLSNYIRNTNVTTKFNPLTLKYDIEDKRIRTDHVLELLYQFKLKKNAQLHFFLAGGLGKMNTNGKLKYNYYNGDNPNGTPIIDSAVKNYSFFAPKISVGICYKNFNATISSYATPDDEYDSNPTLLVEYKLSYGIKLWQKK